MIRYLRQISSSHLIVGVGFFVFIFSLAMLAHTPQRVAAAPTLCRAAIAIDRSGSVGIDDLQTIFAQIKLLFQPGPDGIYDPNVELAFWSFSSNTNAAKNNDAPFHGFVTSVNGYNTGGASYNPAIAGSGSFGNQLESIVSGGRTNYEQGLGYEGYVSGNQTMNTKDNINQIISSANVVALVTDGVPNLPGNGLDDNPTGTNPVAREAARQAVLKHTNAGRAVIGGLIGNIYEGSLNYALNGDANNGTNTFRVTADYHDLAQRLREQITTQCGIRIDPTPTYSLVPSVVSPNSVVSGTDGASMSYNVQNSAASGSSQPTDWSIKQIIVDRNQSATPLVFSGPAYRDAFDCNQLRALVNSTATGDCTIASGTGRIFGPGNTSLDNEVPSDATNVVLQDSWPIGSKVCYVLTLTRPTDNPSTPHDRYSAAKCLTIGKRPQVQVHGGDLKVGRYFIDDTTPVETDPSKLPRVAGKTTPKQDNQTYGGWAEYAIYAPGTVSGFASLSGLEGGLDTTLAGAQALWSKLTFANTDSEYGSFVQNSLGMGTIPDVKTAILSNTTTNHVLGATTTAIDLNGPSSGGRYQKDTGDLTIHASTIEKGKTIVVYVKTGTVIIDGDINYYDNPLNPYTSISEIPQLIIIAKSIVIKDNVGHVSGWLIADDASNGRITTCDYANNLTITDCNRQLRIDGPVMAQHLSLRRTAGAGPVASGSAGDPAEILNLPADAYLWAQNFGGNDARALTTMATELPPYF